MRCLSHYLFILKAWWLFKINVICCFLKHTVYKPVLCKLSGWDRLTAAFLYPVFRRAADTTAQAPLLRVAPQSRTPPARRSRTPPFPGSVNRTFGLLERCPGSPWAQRWSHCSEPGAILDAGSSSSAPIYARRCWRSPLMTRYLTALGNLWILLLRPWLWGIPLSPGGGPGGGLKMRLPVWSAKAPGARLFGIVDGESLPFAFPGDLEF